MQIVVPIWYSEGLGTMPEKKNLEPFLYLKQGWEDCRDHSLHSLCFQVSFSIKEGTHLKMTIHITPNKFKCLNSVLSASHPLLAFQLIPTPLRHCQPMSVSASLQSAWGLWLPSHHLQDNKFISQSYLASDKRDREEMMSPRNITRVLVSPVIIPTSTLLPWKSSKKDMACPWVVLPEL